ncbi:unnamed protein product [marine sediment metagenome]|uniref:Uncharacterized protein n=1 Tax=marine sediment metagenome TaxID=412755 RepID=X0UA54_9ZZZZ
MKTRDRNLYIVELPNGNWATITRIRKEAEKDRDKWRRVHACPAVIIEMQVPPVSHETKDKS